MVTYCPLPPRVSTWIGTCVALGAADAPGAGEALVPPAGAWGAQPGASSSARVAASLAERIGAYYGKGERNDLETEREEQVERVDRAVEQQRDQRRRQTIVNDAVRVTMATIPPSAAKAIGSEWGSNATAVRVPGASGGRSAS